MTDELLRPFRDKLRGRSAAGREPSSVPIEDEVPRDAILIRDLRVGPYPEASPLHPGFVPGLPRVRLTIDLGARFRGDAPAFAAGEREALLRLCPRLLEHACGGAGELARLLDRPQGRPKDQPAGDASDARDGILVAHLIEHVAIEILVGVSGSGKCSGVTCAHRDRLDRFDIYIESADPMAGRACAILAVAVVRDLLLHMGADRLALHRRCRDLLAFLVSTSSTGVVAEDAARHLACGSEEAMQTLEELVRLGYLAAVPSGYLFSSTSGVLFRRSAPSL